MILCSVLLIFRFVITNVLHVKNPEKDLLELKESEARIMFLYATKDEAARLMVAAKKLHMTGEGVYCGINVTGKEAKKLQFIVIPNE